MDGFRLENMWSNIGVKVVNDFNSSSTIVEWIWEYWNILSAWGHMDTMGCYSQNGTRNIDPTYYCKPTWIMIHSPSWVKPHYFYLWEEGAGIHMLISEWWDFKDKLISHILRYPINTRPITTPLHLITLSSTPSNVVLYNTLLIGIYRTAMSTQAMSLFIPTNCRCLTHHHWWASPTSAVLLFSKVTFRATLEQQARFHISGKDNLWQMQNNNHIIFGNQNS
jgi:hypothetical protein